MVFLAEDQEFFFDCILCKSSFEYEARFCGECGVTRAQALGIERARFSQTIKRDEPEIIKPIIEDDKVIPALQTPKPRKPSVIANIRYTFKFFIEQMIVIVNRFAIPIYFVALVSVVGSSYVITQHYIFEDIQETKLISEYLSAVSSRDVSYFDSSKTGNANLPPILPIKYGVWEEANTNRWFSRSNWNGWSAQYSVIAYPQGDETSFYPIYFELKAKREKVFGVFRQNIWSLDEKLGTIEISYPENSSMPIYINGIYAGTVGNPEIKPGKYRVFPGPIKIGFAKYVTYQDQDIFISDNSDYSTRY